MTLTDAQLGRIARQLRNHLSGDIKNVLLAAIDGDMRDAFAHAGRAHEENDELLTVLCEVAAEVEREQRQCRVVARGSRADHYDRCRGEVILDYADAVRRETRAHHIVITNAHHGIEWTWQRESER